VNKEPQGLSVVTWIALLALVFALAFFSLRCQPKQTTHPLPVDADPTGLDLSSPSVCAHLATIPDERGIPCTTGTSPACASSLDKIDDDKITIIPRACWMRAGDITTLRACRVKVCE
jgi:hypothetical protein